MSSIQDYIRSSQFNTSNSSSFSSKKTSEACSATGKDAFGFDLKNMTIDEIRTATDKLYSEGKLDAFAQVSAFASGWLGKGSDGVLGHGHIYTSPGHALAADSSSTSTGVSTYNLAGTLQGAAQFEEASGNSKTANVYLNMLKLYEGLDSHEHNADVIA